MENKKITVDNNSKNNIMKPSNIQTFTLPPSALKLFLGTMLGGKGMNNSQIKTTMDVLDKQLNNEKKSNTNDTSNNEKINDEKINDEKTNDEKTNDEQINDEKDISNNVLDSKKENTGIENMSTVKNDVLDSILKNNKEIGNLIGSLVSKSS